MNCVNNIKYIYIPLSVGIILFFYGFALFGYSIKNNNDVCTKSNMGAVGFATAVIDILFGLCLISIGLISVDKQINNPGSIYKQGWILFLIWSIGASIYSICMIVFYFTIENPSCSAELFYGIWINIIAINLVTPIITFIYLICLPIYLVLKFIACLFINVNGEIYDIELANNPSQNNRAVVGDMAGGADVNNANSTNPNQSPNNPDTVSILNECPICFANKYMMVTLGCEHKICSLCISKMVDHHNLRCPLCRQEYM